MSKNTLSILKKAIEVEDKVYALFSDASSKTNDADMIRILEELAQEELEHRDLLISILEKDFKEYSLKGINVSHQTKFLEIEPISANSSFFEIMRFAIMKSEKAFLFFRELELASLSKEVVEIYGKIANLELALKNRLEEVFFEFNNNK